MDTLRHLQKIIRLFKKEKKGDLTKGINLIWSGRNEVQKYFNENAYTDLFVYLGDIDKVISGLCAINKYIKDSKNAKYLTYQSVNGQTVKRFFEKLSDIEAEATFMSPIQVFKIEGDPLTTEALRLGTKPDLIYPRGIEL